MASDVSFPNDPRDPSLVNPLPFGAPFDYQGGIPEDLAELGFPMPKPPARSDRVPGDSRFILPHIAGFQSIINLASRTYYSQFDEALRDSRQNTYVMRNSDPVLMAALRQRQYPVVQLPYHIEAEDESDTFQKHMADEAMKIFRRIPRFHDMKRQLLEAIWYGKYGVQWIPYWDVSLGYKRMMVRDHAPVMGDKIVMTFGGRPGWLVHGAYQGPRVMTDLGLAHLLSPSERERFMLHTFEPEDADIFQGEFALTRFGYGVRGRIYWWWWQRNVVQQWMMDFLQTIGVGGLMIYYYEEGNDASLQAAQNAASNQQSSTAILMPRRRSVATGGVDEVNKVDRIEASMAGADLIYRVVMEYYNQVMRDYILMERMPANPSAATIGAAENSGADRQRYDAESLDETITRDLLWPIQRYTWPSHPPERCPLRFVSNVNQPDPETYMRSAQMAIGLGLQVRADDAYRIVGLKKPKAGDELLGVMPPPMPGGGDPSMAGAAGPQAGMMDESAQITEGGSRLPWDRSEAARKGWETRRQGSASSLEAAVPMSRRGGKVRMAKRSRPYVQERQMGQRGSDVEVPIPVMNAKKPARMAKTPEDMAAMNKKLADQNRRLKLAEQQKKRPGWKPSFYFQPPELLDPNRPKQESRGSTHVPGILEGDMAPNDQPSGGDELIPAPPPDAGYGHNKPDAPGPLQLARRKPESVAGDLIAAGMREQSAVNLARRMPKRMLTKADFHYREGVSAR